jgi:hypothetical protein
LFVDLILLREVFFINKYKVLIKMDSKELHNLHEAYLDVYAPQENIEEGLRSAVKRLLGGGKKEAEAPKPESRGDQLRKKYNVGPEKSDTSAKRQILDRSRARAEKDEKDYGDKPFQKQVAQKSKAAHDRYLKAGYSKYGADDARGRGSKAAKRAAALNKEEFEIIVNALIEEGYDLSSYTWDEMYEVCLDEAVKGASRHDTEMRKAASTERKAGVKNRLSPSKGKGNADKMQSDINYFDKLTKKNKNVVGLVTKEEVEQIDEVSDKLATAARNLRQKRYTKSADQARNLQLSKGNRADMFYKNFDKTVKLNDTLKSREKRTGTKIPRVEQLDLYDIILSHLVAEGYADTNESALVIMANMSEEWRQSIVEATYKPSRSVAPTNTPVDTRKVVTRADKSGNTLAYQNYKKGDKRYKAADHLGEGARDLDSEKGDFEYC